MSDDPRAATPSPSAPERGVFGNLPDARPGTRSPRRDAARAGRKPNAAKASAAKPKAAPSPKPEPPAPRERPAPKPPREPAPQPEEPQGGGGSEDLAWAGVAVAGGGGDDRGPAREPRNRGPAGERGEGVTVAETGPAVSRTSARYLRVFWERAYRENITGPRGDGRLQPRPGALPVRAAGPVRLRPGGPEPRRRGERPARPPEHLPRRRAELADQRRRPDPRQLDRRSASSPRIGAIWIGASFWGAMDTAFCRIYHVECRGWVEQKRFALVMLLVVIVFLAASVVDPGGRGRARLERRQPPVRPRRDRRAAQRGRARRGARRSRFVIVSLIYYVVPKGHVPWRGVWPGALFVTVDHRDRQRRSSRSTSASPSVDELGGALGFILVALVWFYIVSLALLAGAVINALRFEMARDRQRRGGARAGLRRPRRRRTDGSRSARAAPHRLAERRLRDVEELHARSGPRRRSRSPGPRPAAGRRRRRPA